MFIQQVAGSSAATPKLSTPLKIRSFAQAGRWQIFILNQITSWQDDTGNAPMHPPHPPTQPVSPQPAPRGTPRLSAVVVWVLAPIVAIVILAVVLTWDVAGLIAEWHQP